MNQNIISFAFGELDVSPITIAIMLGLTLFTFLAVAISSLQLLNGSTDTLDKNKTK